MKKSKKISGYIITTTEETPVYALKHYVAGLNPTIKKAKKEWEESIEMGFSKKGSRPKIYKVTIKRVK